MESLLEMRGRQKKEAYVKPELAQVRLQPEEAVLGGCKMNPGYGPALTNCKSGPSSCLNTTAVTS